MMRYCLIVFSIFLMVSCGNQGTDQKTKETPKVEEQSTVFLQSLPEERLIRLWEQATHLDYIFLELPISMNMDNQDAIRSSLINMDPKGVNLHPKCNQHDGNMVFAINGNIVEECMFYFRNDCKYFVWLENGKPAYANPMNDNGLKFFERAFNGAVLQQAQSQQ